MTFNKKLIAIASSLALVCVIAFSAISALAVEADKCGDVDGNGTVDINDATIVQKKILSMNTPEVVDNYQTIADTTGDGIINIKDVTAIQKYIAGIYEDLPYEETTQPATDEDGYYTQIIQP